MPQAQGLVVACGLWLASVVAAPAFDFEPLQPLDIAGIAPSMRADIYGPWEIRDTVGTRRCRITLKREPAIGGLAIDLAAGCAKAFPVMGDIAAWRLLESWTIDLVDPMRKTRVRLSTPDARYLAFGDPGDVTGMDEIVKVPARAPAKKK